MLGIGVDSSNDYGDFSEEGVAYVSFTWAPLYCPKATGARGIPTRVGDTQRPLQVISGIYIVYCVIFISTSMIIFLFYSYFTAF